MDTTTQVTETTAAGTATPQGQTSAVQVPEQQETPQESQSPAYVTKEDLERFGAELLRREKQSSKDRMKAVDDKLNAIKTRLESGGGQLSQQQVSALRAQVEEDLDGGQVEAPASAITPEMQAQADFVFRQIDETFADVGMQVTANDPEWKLVQDVLDNPKGSVSKAIRAAAEASRMKAERVSRQKGSAAARVPSGGAGQQQLSGVSASNAHEYWGQAYKK
jgi:hypothetical protein